MRVWLNIRENSFGVDSVCDEIVSAYARLANSITFVEDLKNLIKIQVSTMNNQNFENPPRKQSNRTKMNIKKIRYLATKTGSAYAQSSRRMLVYL